MVKVIPAYIASAASVSAAIHVDNFDKVYFDLPTFAVGCATTTANVYCLVCDTAAGTFKNLRLYGTYSAGAGIANWEVPSSIGVYRVEVPCQGWPYVKIQLGADTSSTVTANVAVVNNRP